MALVLIVSDYSASGSAILGGAAWDELRVSAMLARNGFSVTQGVGPSRKEILSALKAFGKASRDSDWQLSTRPATDVRPTARCILSPATFLKIRALSRQIGSERCSCCKACGGGLCSHHEPCIFCWLSHNVVQFVSDAIA